MLSPIGWPARFCSGPSRREFLRVGGLMLGGLNLSRLCDDGSRPALVRQERWTNYRTL